MFDNLKSILEGIRGDIKDNNTYSEKRFIQIDKEMAHLRQEMEDLKGFKNRAMAIWAFGIGAVTLFINKYF